VTMYHKGEAAESARKVFY